MLNKKIILALIILSSYTLTELKAQNTIVATGGDSSGNGGNISYSIGQVVYNTTTGINGSISEGIQQPYEISIISNKDNKEINLEATVYPNPTTDFLTLKVGSYSEMNLTYYLYSSEGKQISSKSINDKETRVKMKTFDTGTYYLKVLQDNKKLKTFKIIKSF